MVQAGDRYRTWLGESVTIQQVEQGENAVWIHYLLNGLLTGLEPLEDFNSCILGKQRFTKVG